MATQADVTAIGRAFVAARRAATPLADYPGPLPVTLAQAYAIQDAAIAAAGGRIAGWKVGRINPPHDAVHGASRLAGPIFAGTVHEADDREVSMPMFAGGFGAVEGEFLFRLGPVDPARRTYPLADALDAVDAVHVGIEIASSPLGQINALGPAVTISDFGNNNGLLIGPAIPGWRDRAIDDWPVTTAIDGVPAGTGRAANFPDGTAGSVRFLLETLAARGIAIPAGTWISSGAVSGVHPIAPGQRALVRFADCYTIACRMVAAEPHG